MTMATADTNPANRRSLVDEQAFPDIWAYTRRQGGQWHATALDYSIVGSGATREEALRKLRDMVDAYLVSCAEDGLSPADARRPISPRWTLSLLGDLVGEAVRLALHRRSGRGRVLLPRHC